MIADGWPVVSLATLDSYTAFRPAALLLFVCITGDPAPLCDPPRG